MTSGAIVAAFLSSAAFLFLENEENDGDDAIIASDNYKVLLLLESLIYYHLLFENKKLIITMKSIKYYLSEINLLEKIKDMFYVYCSAYTNFLELILGNNINDLIPSYVMFGSDDNNKGSLDKGKGKAMDEYPDSDQDSDSSDSNDVPNKFLNKGKEKEVDSSPSPESVGSNSKKRKWDDSDLEEPSKESQVHGSLTEEQEKVLRDLEFKHRNPNTNYDDPFGEAEKRYVKIKEDLDQKLAACNNKELTSEVKSEIDELKVVRDHIEGQRFARKLEELDNSYTERPEKRTKSKSMGSDSEEGEWESWDDAWELKQGRQETSSNQHTEQAESSRARCTEEEHRRLDREYEEEKRMEEELNRIEEEENRIEEQLLKQGWFYINDRIAPPVPPWKESEKKPYSNSSTTTPISESNPSSSSSSSSNLESNTGNNSTTNDTSSSTSVPDSTTFNADTTSIPRPANSETSSQLPQDPSVSSGIEDGEERSRRKKEFSNDINSSNDNNTSKRVLIDQDIDIKVLDKPIYQDTINQDLNLPISPHISQDLKTPICPNNGQYLETPISDSQGLHLIKPIPKGFIEWCQDIFIGIPVDNGSPIDYVVDQMTCDMPTYMWDDGD